ncbi:polyprenyl synthetase family protein [Paenibacillus harenae]|uniref:Geranylgeranyl pyrophosphate synthase n=1 Tax=Paenibacillus harenae TaxID=306543 RepID=A0ABT9UDD4_PAEHA|nr:polyprenyl synthetase family protein [Paenibacillus harenae]MDQ0116229.1 geranylgeranyl pyrophosphate synthase [Paenibacillus harenae]
MNVVSERSDTWYKQAEQKAAQYFATLAGQVANKAYATTLTEDIKLWQKVHVQPHSLLSFLTRRNRKPEARHYSKYIRWLSDKGKLDDYLDRSVSYIYMRDLGKALHARDTKARIQRVVDDVKNHLMRNSGAKQGEQPSFMSMAGLYRWAQKEGIENAAIWVIGKIRIVTSNIPEGMNAEQAVRKLIKLIVGVVLHVMDDMDDSVLPEERAKRLDGAIRLGYSYGLTYPFIDDLLDSGVLNAEEKEQYSQMIRTTLMDGAVPDIAEIGEWNGNNRDLIQFVHEELRDAFDFIKRHQRPDTLQSFSEQSYVFFHSQHMDRVKELSNPSYTNEDLYLPVIIKSSSSRLIVRSVIGSDGDEGFDKRTFYYGIYNQLADDFADMFDDMSDGAVTAYTYYLKHRNQRPDLINPYELYWAVISFLIHDVYDSDAKSREVLLARAINGLKRCKQRVGLVKYNEIMDIFASGNPAFNRYIQRMVDKADNVDFYDKLLRDQMVSVLRNDRQEKEDFAETIETVREQINRQLQISKPIGIPSMKETLIDAANYSLTGDGKRLRPILTWVMGVNEYGLSPTGILPLLRSLEYMHTASLIFDDLPSQDNSSSRRGRPTLHQLHNSATAELTGLFLIQKGIEEQASLEAFDPKSVLAVIRYSSQKAADMSAGQAMDLHAKGKALTLEQLNTISYYKTGIAFEASLVMPAILAQAEEKEITSLKKYSYHAGIAFQIKDDLLDAEGDLLSLGKPAGLDVENNNSTFVTILGLEGARKAMWDHYCLAMELLREIPRNTAFLKQLLNYLVTRDK